MCPTFRESFLSASAGIYDPMYEEAGISGRSEEADMPSEISIGLQMKVLENFLGED